MVTLVNRAKMSTSTTGTGTITLGSAETGYQSFADAGVADGDVVRYVIEDGDDWEIGSGTYTATGTSLSRTVDESSNSDAALNLTGSAVVFITAAAGDVFQGELFAENYDGSSTKPSATGSNAIAIGRNATATQDNNVSIGINSDATGTLSSSFGIAADSAGAYSTALGYAAVTGSAANYSLAFGNGSLTGGSQSVAFPNSYSSGTDSFAAGIMTNSSSYGATSYNAIAMGQSARATSSNAIAIGRQSHASNLYATAIGYISSASNQYATAVGGRSGLASGRYSTVLGGFSNEASGIESLVGGNNSTASHSNSIVFGDTASSSAANEITLGSTSDTVRISSAYTLPTSDGTNGQVLTTDGSGAVTFADAAGGGSSGQAVTAITANTTLANSDKGKLIQTETSGITITIPALSGLDDDWFVDIETLNTNTFNHGKVTIDITTNNTGASINGAGKGNATMYGGYRIRLARSPAGGDSDGQLNAYQMTMLTGGIIVREDRLAGNLQGGDVGVGSVMIGNANNASGNDAVCIGQLAKASATGSVAIGSYNGTGNAAKAESAGAVALGSGKASGSASLALQVQADNTTYATSGTSAVAIGKLAKATGAYSTAIGESTQATASNSVCLGYYSQSTAQGSVAIGYDAQATAAKAFSFGLKVRNAIQNAFRFAGGQFSSAGDAQSGIYILKSDTTDATAEAMTTTNTAASTDNQIILPNESAISFSGTVVCREDATDGDDYAGWEVKGVIMRQGAAADTTLGVGIVNCISLNKKIVIVHR